MSELVSAQEAQSRKGQGWKHVDVRTDAEFEAGHPVDSDNIPFMTRSVMGMTRVPTFVGDIEAKYGKTDNLLVSCQSGKRSAMAVAALTEAGFENLADVEGGFMAWESEGLPVAKSE